MNEKQIITHDGKPAYVLVPYDEWRRIEDVLEDRADIAAINEYLANPTAGLPQSVVRAMSNGVSPIKAIREHRGITQVALAEAAGTSPVYISQIERGDRKGGRKLLARLAAALDVNADELESWNA